MSEDPELSSGPIGTGDWTVEPGDSMASIADQTGHYWQTIWDDPANQDLKKTRENPETLLAGDKVTVPSLREKKRKEGNRPHPHLQTTRNPDQSGIHR